MCLKTTCFIWTALFLLSASNLAGQTYSWKYYRPGNTGVMGDYSDALWIDPDGIPYICCYDPIFEEGGFSRFHESDNRWENFSNVDYPVIGDATVTGSARISDIAPDAKGGLWMGTWVGALYFDPAVGPESFVRYDSTNSMHPGGKTVDISVAPDGSVWFAVYSLGPNNGGVVRYVPSTDSWTVWGYNSNMNGWPGWNTTSTAAVQPKAGGGYFVWIEDAFGLARYDSDTDTFTVLPNVDTPGEIQDIPHDDACDEVGNCWMLRFVLPGQPYTLEYQQPDGTWVAPPQPPFGFYGFDAFRAFDDGQVILIGPNNEAWHFDGSTWSNLGAWRPGGFTYAIDMDDAGNVWVSGNGGTARRDVETGFWQRYRLTNTGMMDNFLRDIAFAPNGDVWVTHNGGPGIGGIGVFDGERWHNHNVLTYGLGEDWPFPTDNADAITYRESIAEVAFNPTNNGIRQWDGSAYSTLEQLGVSDGLVEDSEGRLWTMGNYYSFRFHDGLGFQDVEIAGWGTNVVRDPSRSGTVWGCANFEAVRTDGDYYFSREVPDFPELNPMNDVLTGVAAGLDGIAWVGSTDGLLKVDAETGSHEWFHPTNSNIEGFQVMPLAVAPDGRIWFTNFTVYDPLFEASLMWFDGANFGKITREEGLPHEQIYDAELRAIPGGYELWLACASRGIAVLTVNTGVVVEDFTVLRGIQIEGNLDDLLTSDDSYLKFEPGITLGSSEPPVWIEFTATLPEESPESLSIKLEASANTVGITQTIEMFNWNTEEFEEVDSQAASFNNDSVVTVELTANIADYVESGTGRVKTRTGWRATGLIFVYPWTICIDQVVWTVTE